MTSRRSFLQLLGAGIGAALLPACGRSLSSPNGYQFSPLVSVGDPLPGGRTVKELLGHFQWLSLPGKPHSVMFQAVDDQDRTGIYELAIDDGGPTPRVMGQRKVLREGDVLNDPGDAMGGGRTITRHTQWEANASGSTLVIVETEGHAPAVYLDAERTGFRHILGQRTMEGGGAVRFGSRLGSVTLAANHDLMVVAGYNPPADDARGGNTRMGVFFLPGADPRSARLVLASGDAAPGGGTFATFGLAELGPSSVYAVQAGVRDSGGTVVPQIFSGVMGDALSITQLQSDGSFALYHPRFTIDGRIGHVAHLSDTDMELRYDGQTLLATGGASPGGSTIAGIHPPVFTSGSRLLVALDTDGPAELCHFDGTSFKTVLAAGDGIGGKEVQQFFFGTFPRQADGKEVFAALIDFGSEGQSIMLATPV